MPTINTKMSPAISTIKQKNAAFSYFANLDWRNMTAITFTYKKGLFIGDGFVAPDLHALSKNMRYFLNILCKKAKIRKHHYFSVVPVFETFADGTFHSHLAVTKPSWLSDVVFETIIREAWSRTRWGAKQINVRPNADLGWLDYILKLRTKKDFADFIDWDNVRIGIDRS